MLIKLKGILEFSPVDVTRKHLAQSSWKCVAIIKTNCDMDRYYAWFLKKRFNLELNKNLRGAHITIINDKMDKTLFEQGATIFSGKEIEFYLDLEPRSNGEHWWLRVFSTDAENIREALGLSREPYFSFHFTIGHANNRNIEHSEYILEQCKKFSLISNEPRKSLEEYEQIVDFTR
jgi:hypothetical protein